MSISTGSNIIALKLSTQMRKTTARLAISSERLSTGNRINSAADDPAGLAIADRLKTDARLMTVALRNSNDAVTIVTITDDALAEVSNILARMSELATQGANGSYSAAQRSAMQLEFNALGSEVDRISAGTVFNSNRLLSATSDLAVQVGITTDSFSRITIQSTLATLAALGLGSGSALTYSLTGTSTTFAVAASNNALSAIRGALDEVTRQRGIVGAVAGRLTVAIANLTSTRETTRTAETQIREVDVASEVADLVEAQVLQQVQSSLFAQANQLTQRVLGLLGAG